MSQSPELAGGEGFTYEGDVAAFYLSALLAEAYAPGIDDRMVVRVSVQQRDFGEPLDDVIVDFEDAEKESARLSLQVKRSLTISKAKTNKDFSDIIRDSWLTFNKPNFRHDVDRYGAAVGTISRDKERTLKTLCEYARASLTTSHFDDRFAEDGIASKSLKLVKRDIVALLRKAKGSECTNEEVHQFLAHFVLIQFDFLCEGATEPPEAINRIRGCLSPDDADKASLIWSQVVQLARASAGKSGEVDRKLLVRSISPNARLRGATSLLPDLDKLIELANGYAQLIPDDVGGTKLDRTALLNKLDIKLSTSRIVQIRGLPGGGKSVLVRRVVQRAIKNGPVLFLKAEQLEGTSWISYATSQGLSGVSLEQLLVEVGATGTPILFIDAIDRVGKEHQPIILDVIRTIVGSRLLDDWRIVVSLRDTGIEVLRNWLGEFLDVLKVEMLDIGQLTEEEAEILAIAKPHLRPLLFGSAQVQEIVRRPFFAKVLNQNYVADPSISIFAPQSEVDLIENWWRRGGYNETGQSAIDRQLTLLDLAHIRSRQLSQPIGLRQLESVSHINDLKSDGILQNAREGISVRFAHDIFFEWAFFHVLADSGPQWMEVIKTCGEPPAIARVVELASQWEYMQGTDWPAFLLEAERSDLRSQWLRAWLVGPLGTTRFETDEEQFSIAIFADDYRLFRKLLVWFQAEKTTPNQSILAGELPDGQRQQIADFLGWPSDVSAWRRLINFILRRISDIPQRLYPEVVAIFEVWQNFLADFRNPTSQALLQQCANWLVAADANSIADESSKKTTYWDNIPNLSAFRTSLGRILLRSSRSEPSFAADYLQRVTNSDNIRENVFHDIITFSPTLAQSLPQSVVELSLAFLKKELPDEQVKREKKELHSVTEWRKAILAKSESKRTDKESRMLSSLSFPRPVGNFSSHEWEKLSLHDDHQNFWPPSPLREPFHSLFQFSPEEALRLLRDISNHAMTAWRQLYGYFRDRDSNPIPLELTFPWGNQRFWGTDREYLWCRSTWAPKVVGSGFMALEEWCLKEIERGRSANDLIQQIVEGNECIAVLGIASMLVLHTETVSDVTLPLITSQRLLGADFNRMRHDFQSSVNLMGFTKESERLHYEACQEADAREFRKKQLSWMVSRFIFAEEPLSNQAREAILRFKDNLPYQYEEHRKIEQAQEDLTAQAFEYAELVDTKNYKAYRTEENSDKVAIVHVSPSMTKPENIARREESTKYLLQSNLLAWASKSFKEEVLSDIYTIEDAIALAKEADTKDLFEPLSDEDEEEQLVMLRSSVVATAAIALNFRLGCSQEDLKWARNIIRRAILLPEKADVIWSPGSSNLWQQGAYVARGLAGDLRNDTTQDNEALELLKLIMHSAETVSLAALEEACKLWSHDSRLTWSALILALSLCHALPQPRGQQREMLNSSNETQMAVDAALAFYEHGTGWSALPLPPTAWVKIESGKGKLGWQNYFECDADDSGQVWGGPNIIWHSQQAAKILERIPIEEVLSSSAKTPFLDFLAGVLNWVNQKNAPPWAKTARRDRSGAVSFELTQVLGSRIGYMASILPLEDFQDDFLDPILKIEGENCLSLLSPFASSYISSVYDAPTVPTDAVATLDLCLGRFLQEPVFKKNYYRSGEFTGFDQPELARTLMFVSIERADLAARYVNGDWSEISLIMPLIDRFVRVGGWAASVMDLFLTLCKRARASYPSEVFADQVLAVINDDPESLKGWNGGLIPAHIAELVQHFSHRDAPMKLDQAQKFLRILDILVDMGDRRSAALQLGEAFREIRLPS